MNEESRGADDEEMVLRLRELQREFDTMQETGPAPTRWPGTCPHCGHCPHCGRGGGVNPYHPLIPHYYYPYPWHGITPPPYYSPPVYSGSASGAGALHGIP